MKYGRFLRWMIQVFWTWATQLALENKRERGQYDVFLYHKSEDKAAVKQIAELRSSKSDLFRGSMNGSFDRDCATRSLGSSD
jgi:hypothetical protein